VEQLEGEYRRTQTMLDEASNLYNKHRDMLNEKKGQNILLEKELQDEKRRVEKEYDAVLDKNASLTRDMDYISKRKNEMVRRQYMQDSAPKKLGDTVPMYNAQNEDDRGLLSPSRAYMMTSVPSRYSIK